MPTDANPYAFYKQHEDWFTKTLTQNSSANWHIAFENNKTILKLDDFKSMHGNALKIIQFYKNAGQVLEVCYKKTNLQQLILQSAKSNANAALDLDLLKKNIEASNQFDQTFNGITLLQKALDHLDPLRQKKYHVLVNLLTGQSACFNRSNLSEEENQQYDNVRLNLLKSVCDYIATYCAHGKTYPKLNQQQQNALKDLNAVQALYLFKTVTAIISHFSDQWQKANESRLCSPLCWETFTQLHYLLSAFGETHSYKEHAEKHAPSKLIEEFFALQLIIDSALPDILKELSQLTALWLPAENVSASIKMITT
jgi:hypothetical protein